MLRGASELYALACTLQAPVSAFFEGLTSPPSAAANDDRSQTSR